MQNSQIIKILEHFKLKIKSIENRENKKQKQNIKVRKLSENGLIGGNCTDLLISYCSHVKLIMKYKTNKLISFCNDTF